MATDAYNPFTLDIDALPYYDRDIDDHPNLRNQLNSLIAVELRAILPTTATATPANLTHLPAPRPLPPPSAAPLLAAELARLQAKKPVPPGEGIDVSRYAMPAPAPGPAAATVPAWEAAHANSLAQLEHQRLRTLNGTLLAQLGGNAWRVQNFAVENTLAKLDLEGDDLRRAVEDVNRERKRSQEKGGEILTRLEKRWTELVSGNMQLEIGCVALEVEVAQLQARQAELEASVKSLQQATAA